MRKPQCWLAISPALLRLSAAAADALADAEDMAEEPDEAPLESDLEAALLAEETELAAALLAEEREDFAEAADMIGGRRRFSWEGGGVREKDGEFDVRDLGGWMGRRETT